MWCIHDRILVNKWKWSTTDACSNIAKPWKHGKWKKPVTSIYSIYTGLVYIQDYTVLIPFTCPDRDTKVD